MPEETSLNTVSTLLARIDERTAHQAIDIETIKATLASNYVTRQEFYPVRTIVYGLVGTVLTSVLLGLLALVIVRN